MKPTTPTVCADPIPDDHITIPEAAALLTISPSSMWRWLRDGLVRGWRVGRRWRLSRKEVLALVGHNQPLPGVQARADRARELEQVDEVLRAEKIRR